MKVGKAKTRGQEVDKEVGGEVGGRDAVEGEGRRGHGKA